MVFVDAPPATGLTTVLNEVGSKRPEWDVRTNTARGGSDKQAFNFVRTLFAETECADGLRWFLTEMSERLLREEPERLLAGIPQVILVERTIEQVELVAKAFGDCALLSVDAMDSIGEIVFELGQREEQAGWAGWSRRVVHIDVSPTEALDRLGAKNQTGYHEVSEKFYGAYEYRLNKSMNYDHYVDGDKSAKSVADDLIRAIEDFVREESTY